MSVKNYNPNEIFIICTLPNGNTANILSDIPNHPDAIKIKYQEHLSETFSCLDGGIFNVFNACQVGVMEMKVFADSDTKLMFNSIVATNGTLSMVIRNKAQTGDIVTMTGLVIVDSGLQIYGAASERIRNYKFTGKIQAMI